MRLTAGKPKKSRRRKTAPRWRRPALIATAMLAVIGGAATGGWHLWTSGTPQRLVTQAHGAALAWTAAAGLAVDDVVVEGRQRTARAEVLAALGVGRGTPMLALDAEAARVRLEELGWVKRAHVARRLPDQVFVRLEERTALALWQHQGKLALIDRDGTVIQRDRLAGFSDLPIVVGPGANAEAAALLDLVAAMPRVDQVVEAAVRVSDRRWNLKLTGGIDVRLPERDVAGALLRLADLEREHGLFDRDVVAVDLRLPDRLILQLSTDAESADGGKDT